MVGRATYGGPHGLNMFDLLWKRMDELVTAYYEPASDRVGLQGEMKGIAYAIKALYRRSEWWAQELFQVEREISMHAKARYDALKAGEPFPDTAGCHGHTGIITRSPAELKAATKKPTQPRRRVVLPTAPQVSPETAAQIKNGLMMGFAVEDLMNIYQVTREQVEACR